jgi:hypothetical protein
MSSLLGKFLHCGKNYFGKNLEIYKKINAVLITNNVFSLNGCLLFNLKKKNSLQVSFSSV